MDIESFLLTSGFALIVVLIGWSNQITTRSKETRELEQEFIQKAKVKSQKYKLKFKNIKLLTFELIQL